MSAQIVVGLLAGGALAGGGCVEAQTAGPPEQGSPGFSLRVKVDEVVVTFHAADASGHAVNDLKLDELELFDDGRAPARVLAFEARPDLPIRADVLLDTSASMRGDRVRDRLIAMDYARKVLRQRTDMAFVMDFGHVSRVMQPWTRDPEALSLAVREIAPSGESRLEGTSLFDAVFEACHGIFGGVDHAASGNFILLFTDGEDNSSFTTLQNAVDMCQRNNTAIYAFRPANASESGSTGSGTLAALTHETGGRVFHDDDSAERVESDLKAIDADMRNQYRLVYRPAVMKRDGSFHSVVLLAPQRVATVSVRSGYYAPLR